MVRSRLARILTKIAVTLDPLSPAHAPNLAVGDTPGIEGVEHTSSGNDPPSPAAADATHSATHDATNDATHDATNDATNDAGATDGPEPADGADSLHRPSFNKVAFWNSTTSTRNGALLKLRTSPRRNDTVQIDNTEIVLTKGENFVIARNLQANTHADCLQNAMAAANRALDLIAVKGNGNHVLVEPLHDNITWIEQDNEVHARVWSSASMNLPVLSATITVTDIDGNEIPLTPEPPTPWHPSFRYFRLSQNTEDLFDAHRNMHLALEAALSTIAPQLMSPRGRPSEREGEWFKRALTEAGTRIALERHTITHDAQTAVDDLMADVYADVRTGLFHSKAGRTVLIPLDEQARRTVEATLNRLGGLYLALCEEFLGARFATNFFTNAGFALMMDRMFADPTIHLSASPDPMTEELEDVHTPGWPELAIPANRTPDYDRPHFGTVTGMAGATDLADLTVLRRALVSIDDKLPVVGHDFEGDLHTNGLDQVEFVMGIRGTNVKALRREYSA